LKGAEQMFGRSFAMLTLTAAVLLSLPDTSHAQWFRRGGGWRGDGGWYDGGSGYYYNAGYPYRAYYGYSSGYYPYGYSYSYYPRWYGRFGTRYAWSGPTYYTESGPGYYTYRSAYPSTEIVNNMPDPGPSALAAVRVPNPDAQLWIEGQEMTSRGLLRTFISPPLESGKDYSYTMRAIWVDNNGKTVDQTQVLPVRAGQRLAVDFPSTESKPRERRSGYGPQSPKGPPPARDGAAQPRRENQDQSIPPAPGKNPDESKPKRNNGQNERPQQPQKDKPQNPDQEDK
jgi:uncharacterized protein (TIGR03000 family)